MASRRQLCRHTSLGLVLLGGLGLLGLGLAGIGLAFGLGLLGLRLPAGLSLGLLGRRSLDAILLRLGLGLGLAPLGIGQSGQRLVRLVPGAPCTTNCIRVASIPMKGKGPGYCDQGNAQALARLTVTDETGAKLSGVTVTAHFFDDYYLDQTLVGRTNTKGLVTFKHSGPPCVGAIAILVTDFFLTKLFF